MKYLLIALILITNTIHAKTTQEEMDRITPEELDAAMHILVDEQNKHLPRNIDNMTVLNSISYVNKRLYSDHTVNMVEFYAVSKLTDETFNAEKVSILKGYMSDIAHNELCYDPYKLNIMSEFNISYNRSYYREDNNRFIFDNEISVKSCKTFMLTH